MDIDRSHMTESILQLTLEIIHLLTGEDYTIVKKTFGDCEKPSSHSRVSGRRSSTQRLITVPPPHSLIHERHNDQKILELTNKIIQLLTGEEGEYIEEHRGLYKDVMMENHRPLTSLGKRRLSCIVQGRADGPSNRDTPERCSRPLYSKDCTEENHRTPQEDQGEDLTDNKEEDKEGEEETYVSDIKIEVIDGEEMYVTDIKLEDAEEEEETYVRGDHQCKEEEIPTDISTDGCTSRDPLEGHLALSPDFKIEDNITQDSSAENPITLDMHPVVIGADKSPETFNHKECYPTKSVTATHSTSDSGKTVLSWSVLAMRQNRTGEKTFSCSECGKYFINKSTLVKHERSHTGEKPFPCSECGKCFTQKSHLYRHQRLHTGEKPFMCNECGKCFTNKSAVVKHLRSHTGEKPFSCSECEKCFTQKSHLQRHQRLHTGEKPFTCSECGKCFTQKSDLVTHQKRHIGEKQFPCSECGKCFKKNKSLIRHQRKHTNDKLFSCS
ncbi:oocyte zinc finger protein XlCOF7.1-like isoform X2 [Pseudophryne corroboree]|uniref:oocyte zinc finger protein XlCOF7.1-like isoform X2 n=1 Tax=Pseudophryne corroboree TaxID=495146 RepID=UPI00308176CB